MKANKVKKLKGENSQDQKSLVYESKVDVDLLLNHLDVSKPKSAFNFFVKEQVASGHRFSIKEGDQSKFSALYKNLPEKEKARLLQLVEQDKERFKNNLFLVKKHLVQIPLKENSTEYSIFKEEFVQLRAQDGSALKVISTEAREAWESLSPEEKAKYADKKKENAELIRELAKIGTGFVSGWVLFIKTRFAEMKQKGSTYSLISAAADWKNLNDKEKIKFNEKALQWNLERQKKQHARDIYFHQRPRKPIKAFKFYYMELKSSGKLEGQKKVLTYCKEEFEKLTEEQKKKYVRLAEEEAVIYAVKKQEFRNFLKTLIKRPPSAINLFIQEHGERLTAKVDMPAGSYLDFMQKKWAELPEKQKESFKTRVEALKKDYAQDMAVVNARVYGRPVPPRSPLAMFVSERIGKLMAANKQLDIGAANRQANKDAENMSEKEKKAYQKVFEERKALYEKQLEDYKKYFCFSKDGSIEKFLPEEVIVPKRERSVNPNRSKSENRDKKSRSKSAKKEKTEKATKKKSDSKKKIANKKPLKSQKRELSKSQRNDASKSQRNDASKSKRNDVSKSKRNDVSKSKRNDVSQSKKNEVSKSIGKMKQAKEKQSEKTTKPIKTLGKENKSKQTKN